MSGVRAVVAAFRLVCELASHLVERDSSVPHAKPKLKSRRLPLRNSRKTEPRRGQAGREFLSRMAARAGPFARLPTRV